MKVVTRAREIGIRGPFSHDDVAMRKELVDEIHDAAARRLGILTQLGTLDTIEYVASMHTVTLSWLSSLTTHLSPKRVLIIKQMDAYRLLHPEHLAEIAIDWNCTIFHKVLIQLDNGSWMDVWEPLYDINRCGLDNADLRRIILRTLSAH